MTKKTIKYYKKKCKRNNKNNLNNLNNKNNKKTKTIKQSGGNANVNSNANANTKEKFEVKRLNDMDYSQFNVSNYVNANIDWGSMPGPPPTDCCIL